MNTLKPTQTEPAAAGSSPSTGSVIVEMPFQHGDAIIVRADDGLLTERIWLNREQAMHLLEVLPDWIAKLPVAPNDADQRPGATTKKETNAN